MLSADVASTIVLDIDGTLIAEGPDIAETEKIVLRPHLSEFLDHCFDNFQEVHVWTAATPYWVTKVFKKLPRSDFHKVRTGCSRPSHYYPSTYCYLGGHASSSSAPYKMLKKYYDLHRTIIVDNTPSTFRKNYGNAVYIPTFDGTNAADKGLLDTIDLLLDFKQKSNAAGSVRKVQRSIVYTT